MLNLGKLFCYTVNADKDFFGCRSVANHLLQGSRAISDSDSQTFLNNIDLKRAKQDHLPVFVDEFASWVNSSANQIIGLENFEADYSAGTTQSFDSFYLRHRRRRFRCLVGEYFYHIKVWTSNDINWSFISDEDPLVARDALVISAPFCDTGNLPVNYDSILLECSRLSIPVLIDCCYYTIAGNINIDVRYDCIDTVCFSLSKAFPVANNRIGVRYTLKNIFDGQKLHHSINYNNLLSAYIGLEFIKNFKVDYVYNKYQAKQQEISKFFNIAPSSSVVFAVGDSTWSQYSRKNLLSAYHLNFDPTLFANRICLNPVYENWNLFTKFKNEFNSTL